MSLYNEHRPLTLDEVKGQQAIKTQLNGMFQTMNVPNAMLLVGPRGTGKTTIARIIARRLNCENGKGEADCSCASCKAIFSGISSDIIEMDAASNNKVEDVAKIVEQVQYTPDGRYKVFILDEVHMFSNGAWNALLKTLEEPPARVLFLLCTTEEQKIPATIISRCRKLYFEKIDLCEILTALTDVCKQHDKPFSEDALVLIAKASDGCMRDALSILEGFFDQEITPDAVLQALGSCKEEVVFDILDAVQRGDVSKALSSLRASLSRGTSMQEIVKVLMEAVADTMYLNCGASVSAILNTAAYKERLQAFAGAIEPTRCILLTDKLSEVYGNLSKSADAAFLVESALIGLSCHTSELNGLEKRLSMLESGAYVPTQETGVRQAEEESQADEEASASMEDTPSEDIIVLEEEELPQLEDHRLPFGEDVSSIRAKVVEEKSVPIQTEVPPAAMDDIFSHLPQGTVVSEAAEMIFADASTETVNLPFEEEKRQNVTVSNEEAEKTSVLQKIMNGELSKKMLDGLGDMPFFQDLLEVL